MASNYDAEAIVRHAKSMAEEIEKLKAELAKALTPHGTVRVYVDVPFISRSYSVEDEDHWSQQRKWTHAERDHAEALEIAKGNDEAKSENDLLSSNLAKMIEACGLKCEVVDRSWRTGKVKSRTPTEWKSALSNAFPRATGTTAEVEKKWQELSARRASYLKKRDEAAKAAEVAKASEERERRLTVAVVEAAKFLGVDALTATAESVIEGLRSRDKYLNLAAAMSATRSDWSDGFYRVREAVDRFTIETETDKAIIEEIGSLLDSDESDGRIFRDCAWNYSKLFSLADSATLAHFNRVIELASGLIA